MRSLRHALTVGLVLGLHGCATNERPVAGGDPDTAPFPTRCYIAEAGDGSVIRLQYIEYFDEVTGILDYTFADRDGGHGILEGRIEGEVLEARWEYTVEGARQAEIVRFRISADAAYRASGPLAELEDGTLVLRDPAHAQWSTRLARVACDRSVGASFQ